MTTSCSERSPHRHLARPAEGAREEKIGNVRKRDEQDDGDGGQHEEERPFGVASEGCPERDGKILGPLILRRVLALERTGNGSKIGRSLLEARAGVQTTDCKDPPRFAL